MLRVANSEDKNVHNCYFPRCAFPLWLLCFEFPAKEDTNVLACGRLNCPPQAGLRRGTGRGALKVRPWPSRSVHAHSWRPCSGSRLHLAAKTSLRSFRLKS